MRRRQQLRSAVVGVAALALAATATPAHAAGWTQTDPARDAVMSLGEGPSFTPLTTAQAGDVSRVTVESTAATWYVRVDVRELYGARMKGRQEAAQIISVDLGPTDPFYKDGNTKAEVAFNPLGKSSQVRGSVNDQDCAVTASWSSAQDWVLFRIPVACIDLETTTEELTSVRSFNYAYNGLYSYRYWVDDAGYPRR